MTGILLNTTINCISIVLKNMQNSGPPRAINQALHSNKCRVICSLKFSVFSLKFSLLNQLLSMLKSSSQWWICQFLLVALLILLHIFWGLFILNSSDVAFFISSWRMNFLSNLPEPFIIIYYPSLCLIMLFVLKPFSSKINIIPLALFD